MSQPRKTARSQRLPSKWEVGGLVGSVVVTDVAIHTAVHDPARAILLMGAFTGASLGCAVGLYFRRRKELNKRLLPMAWVDEQHVIALLTLDAHGRILSANSGLELLGGYSAEELIGTHFACLYNEHDFSARKPHQLLEKAQAGGTIGDRQRLVRRDGIHFWARLLLTCLQGEGDRDPAFVLALLPDDSNVKDRRTGSRIRTEEPVRLRVLGGSPVEHNARLLDFSQQGIRVAVDHIVAVGANVIAEWHCGFLVGVVRNCRRSPDGWNIGVELDPVPASRSMVASLQTAVDEKNSANVGA